jgi:hypothetical protein
MFMTVCWQPIQIEFAFFFAEFAIFSVAAMDWQILDANSATPKYCTAETRMCKEFVWI